MEKEIFLIPRLNDPVKYPIAVENHFYNVVNNPDLITSKLPALRAYQHSIDAPKPPAIILISQQPLEANLFFLPKQNALPVMHFLYTQIIFYTQHQK